MRLPRLIMALLASLTVAGPGAAQVPPNVLFPGSAYSNLARGTNIWCAIEPGSSAFQRNVSGEAKITMPEISYVNYSNSPAVSYQLVGLAVLSFTTATSGTVAFVLATGAAPTSISRPQFTNYTQTYDTSARIVRVTFLIRFPSCSLPVRLYLRN